MSSAGCVPVTGAPRYGSVGVWTASGIERFDCNGVVGELIFAAIHDFHASQADVVRGAAMMGGFMVRHYLGSQEYCDQTVYSTYMGDRLIGRETVWDDASCVTVHYFWDEWNGGSNNEEIPEPNVGGGGPFYSPTDPDHRTPTIDTMPERNHRCEGFLSPGHPNWKCLALLSTTDSARIYDSLDVYLIALNHIPDSLQRLECDSLRQWMDSLRYASHAPGYPFIWAGRTDSVGPNQPQHYSQTTTPGDGPGGHPTYVHLDPKTLNGAGTITGKKLLLRTLLHESVHAWVGVYHDHSDDSSEVAAGYPNDPFFRTLEAEDACVS